MADRLDGSVARYRREKSHDPRLGAFLDAQGDKVFHIGFLVAFLWMYGSTSASALYVLLALATIVAQSVSFFVRCLDFFLPVVESADAIKAAGEGKLATTFCNGAACVACLMPVWPWVQVVVLMMLFASLDLALRSVKVKLVARVLAQRRKSNRKNSTSEDEEDNDDTAMTNGEDSSDLVFSLVNLVQRVYFAVALRPVAWALSSERFPGMVNIMGQRVGLVLALQSGSMLAVLPFAYCVRNHMVWTSMLIVVAFHAWLQCCQVVANHHRQSKAITYFVYNHSTFVDYVCIRVFSLLCLLTLWSHLPASWSWSDIALVDALLLAYFGYALSLLVLRIDDTMPQHPATVASWARIGGPGVASGTGHLGILRERLRPISLMAMTLTLEDTSLLRHPWGYVAVVTCALIVLFNHWDLMHKLRVRAMTHNIKVESINTLAEQDPSLQQDRSEDPPQYEVVVTIGCFDLFHEGHIKLMQRMRSHGKKLLVGLHDDESINLLKGRFPVDNVVKRMRNVKKYCDQVFVIPSTDPSPYLDAAVDRSIPKENMCFIRGADMPNFPGRIIAEQLMQIKLTPYTEGVSSTMLRAKLTERTEGDSYRFSGGTYIWYHDGWINTSAEPVGTAWIEYGFDYYRYRTSESSPTIW